MEVVHSHSGEGASIIRRARRIATGLGIVVLAAFGVLALIGALVTSEEERVSETIDEATDAMLAGDGERLCGLLGDSGQRELPRLAIAQGHEIDPAASCEQAAESIYLSLPELFRSTVIDPEAVEREVTIDGSGAEARAPVAGFTEVVRLREEDGEWRLASAQPAIEIDESFVPSDEHELRQYVSGVCVDGAQAVTRVTVEVMSHPRVGLAPVLPTMFQMAAATQNELAAQLRRLVATDAGGEILAGPLAAAERRAGALERAAIEARERPGALPRYLVPINRAYDEAFAAAGIESCRTVQGLNAG